MLLTLDLATTLGWAFGDPFAHRVVTPLEAAIEAPPIPEFGEYRFARKNCPDGEFYAAYEQWLQKMINDRKPSLIFFEAPYVSGKMRQETGRKLSGLAAITDKNCFRYNIECREAAITDIRMHFIGACPKRDKAKQMAIEACLQRRWDVQTNNEAEALALFDYAAWWLQERARAA